MIADAIKQAQKRHRGVIERTYFGRCIIYEKQSYKDQQTKETKFSEVIVQDDIPCHLSYSSTPVIRGGEGASALAQTIKLFLAPECLVAPGSRIEVTQDGITGSYCRSGQPAVYASHQEVELTLFKGYA